MKTFILSISILLLFCGLVFGQDTAQTKKLLIQSTKGVQTDSVEYDVMIIDQGFDIWLMTVAKPMAFYSKGYLENRNRLYVQEWNARYFSGRDPMIIESMIDYQPGVDYGLEVNYKLFEYFQYVEEKLKLKLLK